MKVPKLIPPGVAPKPMKAAFGGTAPVTTKAPAPPAVAAKPKRPFMAEKLGKGEVKHPSSHAEFLKLGA